MENNTDKNIRVKSKKIINSFKYAFEGFVQSLKAERNMKIHISVMLVVILCGFIFKISRGEWIICIILFGIVISAELFNTAIETVVDIAMPEKNDKAKTAKDVAAAGVLIIAISSAIIGLIIFIPKMF